MQMSFFRYFKVPNKGPFVSTDGRTDGQRDEEHSYNPLPLRKSDKNGIFDIVTSCFLFDKYIFLRKYFRMSCN